MSLLHTTSGYLNRLQIKSGEIRCFGQPGTAENNIGKAVLHMDCDLIEASENMAL